MPQRTSGEDLASRRTARVHSTSPTYPFVTWLAPLRYRDFPAGHTPVRASASYVESLGENTGTACFASRDVLTMVARVRRVHRRARAPRRKGLDDRQ